MGDAAGIVRDNFHDVIIRDHKRYKLDVIKFE